MHAVSISHAADVEEVGRARAEAARADRSRGRRPFRGAHFVDACARPGRWPSSVVKCPARGRDERPAERVDAGRPARAEDDDLARAIALSSDAAPQQGDADLAAAIDLSAADAAAGDDLLAQALAASIKQI